MSLTIIPYQGISEVYFGMRPEQVEDYWGRPQRCRTTSLLELEEIRDELFCRYSSTGLVEISFGPACHVLYKSTDLLNDINGPNRLLEDDPQPYELHGFLVFFQLGIAVTGIHDHDPSQIAATVFVRGRWDRFRLKMNAWTPNEDNNTQQTQ